MLLFWLERQRYDRAVEEGHKLLALDPNDSGIHRIVGIAWLAQGDIKRAENHLRESIRTHPDDASSQALLALLRSNPFTSRSSDCHAIAALALDPDSIISWQALGQSALADDAAFSMHCSQRMLQLEPRNIEARILLFAAISMDEEKPGSHETAERWLQEGLEIEPDNAYLHALLGNHLIGRPHRGKEGEAHLRTALMLNPASQMAASWREMIASQRDWGLRLLNFPRKLCTTPMLACGRAVNRYPLLILLGQFFLVLVILCLIGLISWLVFLWPVVWLYQRYVVHGDLLRATIAGSRLRTYAWLVPSRAWLRRIVIFGAMLLWWMMVPMIIDGINHLHPKLNGSNLMVVGVSSLILGGLGLLLWMEIRKRARQRVMRWDFRRSEPVPGNRARG